MLQPFVPQGRVLDLPGRGDTFVRVHHAGPDRPTLLLLHGWTNTADLNWFGCYEPLSRRYNLVAMDLRGHGRGLHSTHPFALEAAADDAAAALAALGVDRVIAVGYSMGGPIALHLADRHPGLVDGLVLTATAARFNRTILDRLVWSLLPVLTLVLRHDGLGVVMRRLVDRHAAEDEVVAAWRDRLIGETKRGSTSDIVEAGRALSRLDARDVAEALRLPAAVVITSADRAVSHRSQVELARLLDARVLEVEADHDVFLARTAAFSSALLAAVEGVADRVGTTRRPRARPVRRHARRWRRARALS